MNHDMALEIFARIEALEKFARKHKQQTMPKTKRLSFRAVIFRDRKRQFRWHILARNKKIVACSGEGYLRLAACLRSLRRMLDAAASIPVEKV